MRIAILYTSVGLGHKIIALNLADRLRGFGADVLTLDVLEVSKGKATTGSTWLHSFINRRFPWFWKFLYDFGYLPFMPFRVLAAKFSNTPLALVLSEFAPDVVIPTQTTATALAISLLGKDFSFRIFPTFSDYHFHPFWYYAQADGYLVNILDQVPALLKRGVKKENVFQVGFGSGPALVDEYDFRKEYDISVSVKIVLVTSGSLGLLIPDEVFDALLTDPNLVVVLITGKNTNLFERFHGKSNRLIVLPWFEHMGSLYKASDVVVGKPGGLTVFELLRLRIPLFVTHVLPGQEDLNMKYLSTRKLVVDARPILEKSLGEFKDLIIREAYTKTVRDSKEFLDAVSNEKIFDDNTELVRKFYSFLLSNV